MRIIGTVTVNGVRVAVDWRIRGTSIEAGPGLSASDVKLLVPLPDLQNNTSGTSIITEAEVEETPVEEVVPQAYEDMTVTDLRIILERRGLPVSGKKAEMIQRLMDDDAGETAVEEDVEDAGEE